MQGVKKKGFVRLGALVLSTVLAATLFVMPSLAAKKNTLVDISVSDTRTEHYAAIPLYMGGERLSVDARLINETTYVPLRAFSEAVADADIKWYAATRTAVLTADGLSLTVSDKGYYIEANGRYLYLRNPAVILSNGTLYLPIRPLAKALGVDIGWNASERSVKITGSYTPIESGDSFYDKDEVYWLSRIISAESRGEPLLGQIAVGNVVLNRVESSMYPDTIYGVIFDRKYGTQFSPVSLGTIYNKPYWLSEIAAKLCLDGAMIDDRVLFFVEPRIATSSWIQKNRTYAFTVLHHDFYY